MNKEELLLHAKEQYYLGQPIMSDDEYDALEASLKDQTGLIVGFVDRNAKHPHPTSMLSLAKVQSNEEDWLRVFLNWVQDCSQKSAVLTFLCTPKFDGNAINLVYRAGELRQALSRGDGVLGRDLINKIKCLSDVPLSLDESSDFEVRGEIVIPKHIFEEKYADQKNPRNFVAGVLNRDEIERSVLNDLRFVPYEVRRLHAGLPEWSEVDFVYFCERNQFKSINYLRKIYSAGGEKISDILNDFLKYREVESEYQLDGVVVSVMGCDFPHFVFGLNDRSPKWKMAIKFPPVEMVTEVKEIEWNISKAGRYIPTLKLRPVAIDGSVVSRATGHNYRNLRENGLGVGAVVRLAKAGDIIPEVQSVTLKSNVIPFPERCEFSNRNPIAAELHIVCGALDCVCARQRKFVDNIKIWGLERIGPAHAETIFKYLQKNFVLPNFEFFKLDKNDLAKAGYELMGRQNEIIYDEICRVKSVGLSLQQIILSLPCFEDMGAKTAGQIQKKILGVRYNFKGLQKSLVAGWNEGEKNRLILEQTLLQLKEYGVRVRSIEKESSDDVINVLLTGSPDSAGFASKKEFLQHANDLGVLVEETSINQAKYLITDSLDSTSSKMKKAKSMNLPILTYQDFINLLQKNV